MGALHLRDEMENIYFVQFNIAKTFMKNILFNAIINKPKCSCALPRKLHRNVLIARCGIKKKRTRCLLCFISQGGLLWAEKARYRHVSFYGLIPHMH